MKNLTQYIYSVTNAFFKYYTYTDLNLLITTLNQIQNHAKINLENTEENMELWFKFGNHDTIAWDIQDIKNTLNLNHNTPNKILLMENIKNILSINPDNQIKVFLS